MQKINKEAGVLKAKTTKLPARPSQKSILAGVVRKRVANDTVNSNDKAENVPAKVAKVDANTTGVSEASNPESKSVEQANSSTKKIDLSVHNKGALKCIGILPGIGKYNDSSDSEKSTDTEEDYDFTDFDWVGRKVKQMNDDGCDD